MRPEIKNKGADKSQQQISALNGDKIFVYFIFKLSAPWVHITVPETAL
jgi:hypothetical protein